MTWEFLSWLTSTLIAALGVGLLLAIVPIGLSILFITSNYEVQRFWERERAWLPRRLMPKKMRRRWKRCHCNRCQRMRDERW